MRADQGKILATPKTRIPEGWEQDLGHSSVPGGARWRIYVYIRTSISTTLAESGETPMTVKFQLQYFNSGSSRKILEIIKMIDASDTAHNIEWLADPEDDEMIDHGNRFSRAVSKAGFTVVEEEL